MDRLAAFYHWHDPQALDQALLVAECHSFSYREIHRWSVKENALEKYEQFKEALRKRRKQRRSS